LIDVLGTVRVGQLTGTASSSWPLLVDPLGWPLLTDTGRWNVIGVDLGANARHSDGRMYVFFGDVATDRSGDPPENADLVAWIDEPAVLLHGGHLALGWNFQLPVTRSGVAGQPDWQFCLRCSALFWNGDPDFKGRCANEGTHDTFGLGLNFSLPFVPTTVQGQVGWRFCGQCASLFWTDDQGVTGSCPAGGSHWPAGWTFVIPVTPAATGGQPDWRFCGNCHGLFWDGEASKGVCVRAAGGGFHLRGVLQNGSQLGRFDPFRAPEPIGYTGSLETPNGAFSFDRRMYVFAGVADAKYSHRSRPGDPQPGQYLFSKLDPSQPGPYETEFIVSPKLGWCARDDSRTVFESHSVLGLHFLLPHDLPADSHLFGGWRCCRKCEAVFWDGNRSFKGVCQRNGSHEADPDVRGDFMLEQGLPEDRQHQSNWQLCRHCLALYWANTEGDRGLCPAAGEHESTGVLFRVPHRSIEPDGIRQPDWRFCRKCFALFWDGGDFKGICPKDDGAHEVAGFNFLLPFQVEDPGEQPHWRYCLKCAALFLEGESSCPSDHGPHEAAGWFFFPAHDVSEDFERQGNWRRCTKCSGLYFNGYRAKGRCPRDGQEHDPDLFGIPGPNYVLEHNPGADANNRDAFRFCVRCHGLVRTDQIVAYPWTAPFVVNNAEHEILVSNVGQGVVMIGYDWGKFRLSWMPLTAGLRPRYDSILYYHVGKRQWSDTIDNSAGYELFSHPLPGQYTHVSAMWHPGPRCWIILFATAWDVTKTFTQPIVARVSHDLISWSPEIKIFEPAGAYGHWMHDPDQHDRINPDIPPAQPPGQDNKGWPYGAFILDRYTTWDEPSRTLTLTYLLSPSSPYQVQLMQTMLRLPENIYGLAQVARREALQSTPPGVLLDLNS
jgi:hypothetical protein